jgi:hypothetical protein
VAVRNLAAVQLKNDNIYAVGGKMSLNEQIAVLDGVMALDPNDGRIGQHRATATQYARRIAPGVLARSGVLDASAGANYSGGSSYAPGLPLMPSSVGLAGFGSMPGVLPPRIGVIDASGGANYSGGSSYAPGLPLLPSNAGLADGYGRAGLGSGEYGRAGLGGEYGRAGLGRLAGSNADADLLMVAETMEIRRTPAPAPTPATYKAPMLPLDPNDGRIGQFRATATQYARQIAPGVLSRSGVIDASAGANYSGGSSYAPGLPLLPSSVGLAGLDAVPDAKLGIEGPLKKKIGKDVIKKLKQQILSVEKMWGAATPAQKDQLFDQYRMSVSTLLRHLMGVRQMRGKALALKAQGVKLPKAA